MQTQRGASMVEFLIALPLLMFMGLGIIQFGLIYHAKTILNYATFEAARTGAVAHAQIKPMRKELGIRLAPIFGGDGSTKKAATSLARSLVSVNDTSVTKIKVLNPTSEAFIAYGEPAKDDKNEDVIAIPNSHLRYRPTNVAGADVSIQDANLLKIEVTYGYQMRLPILDMKVPLLEPVLRHIMVLGDPDNAMYYLRGMIPLKSVATVRMQSDAWEKGEDVVAVRSIEEVDGESLVNNSAANGGTGTEGECSEVDDETGLSQQESSILTIDDQAEQYQQCTVPSTPGSGLFGGGNGCGGTSVTNENEEA